MTCVQQGTTSALLRERSLAHWHRHLHRYQRELPLTSTLPHARRLEMANGPRRNVICVTSSLTGREGVEPLIYAPFLYSITTIFFYQFDFAPCKRIIVIIVMGMKLIIRASEKWIGVIRWGGCSVFGYLFDAFFVFWKVWLVNGSVIGLLMHGVFFGKWIDEIREYSGLMNLYLWKFFFRVIRVIILYKYKISIGDTMDWNKKREFRSF